MTKHEVFVRSFFGNSKVEWTEQYLGTDLSQLQSKLNDALQITKQAKHNWSFRRKSAARNVQNFAAHLSEFVTCYSGLIEIVKGADREYGGMAYGTMSLLLTVRCHSRTRYSILTTSGGKNKQRKEEKIEDTFRTLKAAVPRIESTMEVYPSEKLQALAAEVYADILHFLEGAITYYTKKGYGTLLPLTLHGR